MRLFFWKMHGAGNDFALLDNRGGQCNRMASADWTRLAERRTGIGCEGFILLENSATADFRMSFLNPDGSAAALCGNGTRCAARRAHALGMAPRHMQIETGAGNLEAEMLETGRVRIALPAMAKKRWALCLEWPGSDPVTGHFIQAGVPHFVVPVDDAETVDLATLGSAIRHHPALAPEGANVNFVSPRTDGDWRLRTFERGVEAESGACGSGALATAATLHERLAVPLPIVFRCTSGEDLRVDRSAVTDGAWSLEGSAVDVFQGELHLEPSPA